MNREYWIKYYKKHKMKEPSSFARFVKPWVEGLLVDLGCGDGRDLDYFDHNGIICFGADQVKGSPIEDLIKYTTSPSYVYARFLWHAIDRKLQLAILKWTKHYIFIEARTTEDKDTKKIFKYHKRNYVNVSQIVKDLKDNGFEIEYLKEGRGLAVYKTEDPHIIRIIAKK